MADPFIAEIRIFPFNFAPMGWAFCNGQLVPISQNTALFSLLGTTYGGDGRSNYALPNLQGSAPMQSGQGNGLSMHDMGETGGSDTVTLLVAEMPSHTHFLCAATDSGDQNAPAPTRSLAQSDDGMAYQNAETVFVPLSGAAIAPLGGGQPHNNLMPYLALNFCIAMQGVYPTRP